MAHKVPTKLILVAEDNEETRYTLTCILASNGYEVIEAPDGKKALEEAQSILPDLIIVDIVMPVMDGLTLIKHLKSNSDTRDIPIICISAKCGFQNFNLEKIIDAFIPKPFEVTVLLNKVKELI